MGAKGAGPVFWQSPFSIIPSKISGIKQIKAMQTAQDLPPDDRADVFLVCGLGRLGQKCVALLKEFGVRVVGVDLAPEKGQRRQDAEWLDAFYAGDCSQAEILKKAGVEHCRAALLVTGDERNNIAAAFMARSLNPNVRLIIRSAQENLNALLRQQLGNLVAFEPSQFSANAFALAALGGDTQAYFDVDGFKVRVGREIADAAKPGLIDRRAFELNNPRRRILSVTLADEKMRDFFFAGDPDKKIDAGDVVTFFESGDRLPSQSGFRSEIGGPASRPDLAALSSEFWLKLKRFRTAFKIPRVASTSFAIMIGLLLLGALFYRLENSEIGWFDALNVAIVLAFGGFDNVFGALHLPFPISNGLYAYSVFMTICSAVFLGVVFATLTEWLLSARLQIARRRPVGPTGGHVIVIGMGPIGQKIAAILREWRQPTVGVSTEPVGEDILPDMPIHVGPLREALTRANAGTARSVIAVMDDQVANLEVSLLARSMNPACEIVFRTGDQELARNVASLVPASTGLSDFAIAAEAIAGAAFGENIISAFHLDARSALVTEYSIQPGDTLIGRNLSEIAYGYGVAPILHRRGVERRFNPSDDIVLEADDMVVVLATVDGLRRVETGERAAPQWRLLIASSPSDATAFEAANAMARISGCTLTQARAAMQRLPSRLEKPLYQQQGSRLMRELRKLLVMSRLERDGSDAG